MSRGLAVPTLVAAIVIIIVGLLSIVIFLGPSGLLNKAAEKSYAISDQLPIINKDIGRIEIQQPSKEIKDGFDSLIMALNTKSDKPCIVSYALPSTMDGFTFEFLKQENGWLAKLKNPDKQVTHFDTVENEVCVVGGEIYGSDVYLADVPVFNIDNKGEVKPTAQSDRYAIEVGTFLKAFKYNQEGLKDLRIAAKNFYTNWIAEIPPPKTDEVLQQRFKEGTPFIVGLDSPGYASLRGAGKRIVAPDYTNPTFVAVTSKTTMEYSYPNDKENRKAGKEDGELLYVAGEGKVCLVGTIGDYFNWYSEKGLHKDSIAIIRKPSSGLKKC